MRVGILVGVMLTLGAGDPSSITAQTPQHPPHVQIQTQPSGSTGIGAQSPLVINWKTADWGPPTNRPRFPTGLRNAPITTDLATGGVTYLARFPAGSRFELHWHTYTETVVVLDGTVDIVMEGVRHTAGEGSYILIPGLAHHTWEVPDQGDVVLLARRDGPADFHFVDP